MNNEDMVVAFFSQLDSLENDEVYLLTGGARKKYAKDNPDISTSHEVVTRRAFRVNNDFDKFLSNIEKIQSDIALSSDKNTAQYFPKESHVVWIQPNPRSTIKAYNMLKKKLDDHIYQLTLPKGDKTIHFEQLKKLTTHFYSSLQKSPSRRLYDVCDIDSIDFSILRGIVFELKDHIEWITRTRGGFHIVYRVEGNAIVYTKGLHTIYKDTVEWQKDRMTYVWGIPQGGFIPKQVTIEEALSEYCCCGGLMGCTCDDVCGEECLTK